MVEDGYRSNIDCHIQQSLTERHTMVLQVKKIVATYTLVEAPSTDGSAIVKLYHDPTKTLFIGSQTDDTNKNFTLR